MDLSGWIRRQCLVLGLSGVIIYVWRYSGVKFWRCQLSAAMSRGQWFLVKASRKKAVWSRVRGEGSSHPRRMWCQAEWAGLGGDGGSRVAAWVTVIRPTQKITQWQPLLSFSLLFGSGDGGHSCSWNFLQSGRRSGKVIKRWRTSVRVTLCYNTATEGW